MELKQYQRLPGPPRRCNMSQVCKEKGAGREDPCMRIKTSVTPICSSSLLPPPLLPWRPVGNGSKPYAPRENNTVFEEWKLARALSPIPHRPGVLQKAAFCQRVRDLLSIDPHPLCPSLLPTCSFLNSHHTASVSWICVVGEVPT